MAETEICIRCGARKWSDEDDDGIPCHNNEHEWVPVTYRKCEVCGNIFSPSFPEQKLCGRQKCLEVKYKR